MKIFESGDSVARKFLQKRSENKTFVCVDENSSNDNIQQAFENMKQYLQTEKGLQVTSYENKPYTCIVPSGDLFTLAHDRTFVKDKLIVKPSNILRHITTQPFTLTGLYEDENGEIIDLTTRAKKDIHSKSIVLCQPFINEFKNRPDIIIDILDYLVTNGYKIQGDIENYFFGNIPQIAISNPNTLLNQLFEKNTKKTIDVINNYDGLRTYLYKYCNLQLVPKMEMKEYVVEKQKPKSKAPSLRNLPLGTPLMIPNYAVQLPQNKYLFDDVITSADGIIISYVILPVPPLGQQFGIPNNEVADIVGDFHFNGIITDRNGIVIGYDTPNIDQPEPEDNRPNIGDIVRIPRDLGNVIVDGNTLRFNGLITTHMGIVRGYYDDLPAIEDIAPDRPVLDGGNGQPIVGNAINLGNMAFNDANRPHRPRRIVVQNLQRELTPQERDLNAGIQNTINANNAQITILNVERISLINRGPIGIDMARLIQLDNEISRLKANNIDLAASKIRP